MLPFRLADISRVEFYKRDVLTSDLICCETVGEVVHFSHEEAAGWKELIEALQSLPGFDAAWFEKVSQPPFAENRARAFDRAVSAS